MCLLGFWTPFFDSGAFNAATGALGLWTWYAAFVVWVFLASLMLTVRQRRPADESTRRPRPPNRG